MNPITETYRHRWAPPRFPLLRSILGVVAACCAALIAVPAQGSTGTVSGRVSNVGTGAYLQSAEVRLAGTDRVTMTTDGGRYVFFEVPAGEVSVVASYTGLDPQSQTVTVVEGAASLLNFDLTNAQYQDVVVLEAFVVAGEREGSAKAIVEQRYADNIKNVIASDAFGAVAEDNVGEFLKFVSGLSIDYNEADARQVRVRGMSAKYASVTIDGNPVASADFDIAVGRGFQFEQVSLSTADSIDVNKTPLADQAANSLAGVINVKSKSAFDQKGRRITYNANLTLNEYAMTLGETTGWDDQMRRKAMPGGSLMFSDTFFGDRLGVVASISHSGSYIEQKVIAGVARTFDTNPDNNETEIPQITQVNWQDGLKPTYRSAAMLNLDYRATENIVLSLRSSFNQYDAPFHNRNWTFDARALDNDMTVADYGVMKTTATSVTDANNRITIAGTNFRKYGETTSVNPAIAWQISDIVKFDGSFAYSRSYQWYDSAKEGFFNIVSVRMPGVSWGFTSDAGSTALQVRQYATTVGDTRSFFDVRNYNTAATARTAERTAQDQNWTSRGDVTINLEKAKLPTVIKLGVDSRLHVKDIENWTKEWSMNVDRAAGGLDLALYPDPYVPNMKKGESFTDANGVIGAAPSLDKWALYQKFLAYNTDPLTITTTAQQPFTLSATQVGENWRNKLRNMWDWEETVESAYAMASMKPTPKLGLVAGLRLERTKSEGRAFDDIGATEAIARSGTTNTNDLGYVTARFGGRRTKVQSYTDLFPSMQVRYAPNDRFVVRGAYYRSISRPEPRSLSTSLTETVETDGRRRFATGNPNLLPEYADNFDLRVEYYFEPVGVVSAGVFYKNLTDIHGTATVDFIDESDVPQDVLDLTGQTAATLVTDGGRLRSTFNGPDTTISGLELEYSQQLSFLPGGLKDLSAFANYTYTKLDQPRFFLGGSGVPTHAANAGLSYNGKRFTAQLKFNWVGERMIGTPGYRYDEATLKWVLSNTPIPPATTLPLNSGINQYESARTQVDLNLEYKMDRRATLFLNVANLLNAPSFRYAVNDRNLIRHFDGGARYTIGIKGTF